MNHAPVLPRSRQGFALLGLLLASPAAYPFWEFTPQLEAGITYETNPRYFNDGDRAEQELLSPGITDDVLGTITDVRLISAYTSTTNQISITPRVRNSRYLKGNQDLDDSNEYLDFSASHLGNSGSAGLGFNYSDVGIVNGEFEPATPVNPNDPPPISAGSGRFSNTQQKSWYVGPYLNLQLSPRNTANFAASTGNTTYNEDRQLIIQEATYYNYDYSSGDIALRHALDESNGFSANLNTSIFTAQKPNSPLRNKSESFGVSAVYDYAFSTTLTGSATIGLTRTSINLSGIAAGLDPVSGFPCSPEVQCSNVSEAQNVVGSLELRKRSELTNLNFFLTRAIAPSSDGTEVVQDTFRFLVERKLTSKLRGSLATIYLQQSAVGQVFRSDQAEAVLGTQNRKYVTLDGILSWNLTANLTFNGAYTYYLDRTDFSGANTTQNNNRLIFGFVYRGTGFRN